VVADNGVVAAGGRLTDWISLGVLASSVPRDAVDEAVAAAGRVAKRSDGKLPPHVIVYFAMALALFADEDYEEVAARLTETLASWGCWDQSWATPTSGGITQARKRLGPEPLELLFDQVAVPVAGVLTRGAFVRQWRVMAIDGFELDVPDTPANAAAFGYPAGVREHPAFAKVRVVTTGECGSHAKVAAQVGPVGGKGSSEQALARRAVAPDRCRVCVVENAVGGVGGTVGVRDAIDKAGHHAVIKFKPLRPPAGRARGHRPATMRRRRWQRPARDAGEDAGQTGEMRLQVFGRQAGEVRMMS
jgi:hypothetical protein